MGSAQGRGRSPSCVPKGELPSLCSRGTAVSFTPAAIIPWLALSSQGYFRYTADFYGGFFYILRMAPVSL